MGSRHPERWTGTRPAERIDTPIGQWIGRQLWADRVVPRLRRALLGTRRHPPATTPDPAEL